MICFNRCHCYYEWTWSHSGEFLNVIDLWKKENHFLGKSLCKKYVFFRTLFLVTVIGLGRWHYQSFLFFILVRELNKHLLTGDMKALYIRGAKNFCTSLFIELHSIFSFCPAYKDFEDKYIRLSFLVFICMCVKYNTCMFVLVYMQ